MASSIFFWTGDAAGSFTVNIDRREMFRPTIDFFQKFLFTDGNRRKVTLLIVVVLFINRVRIKTRHDNREAREREKARIREEEKKKYKL